MTLEAVVKMYEHKVTAQGMEPHAMTWLITELSGFTPTEFYINMKQEVSPELLEIIESGYQKYVIDKIPVQHIVGYSYFYGYKFDVSDQVLIPRRETEQLVEETIHIYDKFFEDQKIDVLDLGTGSGAIAITLSIEEPNMKVDASDISTTALAVAKTNQLNLSSKVNFIVSDWFSNIDKKYDIIVANPPYIPNDEAVEDIVLKEPSLALFGGLDGLEPYEIILKHAHKFLKERSVIAFEHSMYQSKNLKSLILKYFKNSSVMQLEDLQGKDRMTFVGLGILFDEAN